MRLKSGNFEERILWLAFSVAVPGLVAVGLQLWMSGADAIAWMLHGTPLLVISALLASHLRKQIVFPLSTVANLLEALREGDFSLRAKRAQRGDAIGELFWEVNELAAALHQQRLRSEETVALLGKVLANIDLAILAFDHNQQLRMINTAGERLLAAKRSEVVGRSAEQLGLGDCIGVVSATVKRRFPGGAGTWDLRQASFRENGMPQTLLVITDLSRALREEERQAWQRLIRVLGHELNNSLAPIKSIAATLVAMLREPPSSDNRADLESGLRVIESRAESLNRFVMGYATLARLPAPSKRLTRVADLVSRIALLEQRLKIEVDGGEDVEVEIDAGQLEQALINLVKNACDATLPHGGVRIRWRSGPGHLRIEIEDDGPGLSDTDNLFVPFFTTKPGGSGIGLPLARQIAEAHSGTLTLTNRGDGFTGCVACIEIPR